MRDKKDAKGMIQHSRPPAGRGNASLDEARLRQQAIGVKLRQMFDEVLNEPVPDDFLNILRTADSSKTSDDN